MRETGFDLWVRKIPWRREWLPTLLFLSGEFHGRRSLADYTQWGCKELDMTEQLSLSLLVQKCTAGFSRAVLPARVHHLEMGHR